MSIESIEKDILTRLEIDPRAIHLKFKSLEGTRHIIQYEHPDYVFTLSKTFKPRIEAYGVTNRCADGKFVLFLEYDNIYKEIVYKNLKNLIKTFPGQFENFYIAETEPGQELNNGKIKGSYHVVNFTKHYKREIDKFLKLCDVDPYFIDIPKKTAHKCHILRITEKYWKVNGEEMKQKPRFIETYPALPLLSKKKSSTPHYKLFSNKWGIQDPHHMHKRFDGLKKIELHKYSTPKGVNL